LKALRIKLVPVYARYAAGCANGKLDFSIRTIDSRLIVAALKVEIDVVFDSWVQDCARQQQACLVVFLPTLHEKPPTSTGDAPPAVLRIDSLGWDEKRLTFQPSQRFAGCFDCLGLVFWQCALQHLCLPKTLSTQWPPMRSGNVEG
jgi:hypothetical protein